MPFSRSFNQEYKQAEPKGPVPKTHRHPAFK
jgi:hypothetical protein